MRPPGVLVLWRLEQTDNCHTSSGCWKGCCTTTGGGRSTFEPSTKSVKHTESKIQSKKKRHASSLWPTKTKVPSCRRPDRLIRYSLQIVAINIILNTTNVSSKSKERQLAYHIPAENSGPVVPRYGISLN